MIHVLLWTLGGRYYAHREFPEDKVVAAFERAERDIRRGSGWAVYHLAADSIETLKVTHGNLFGLAATVRELVEEAVKEGR